MALETAEIYEYLTCNPSPISLNEGTGIPLRTSPEPTTTKASGSDIGAEELANRVCPEVDPVARESSVRLELGIRHRSRFAKN